MCSALPVIIEMTLKHGARSESSAAVLPAPWPDQGTERASGPLEAPVR
jgi:hypothetical protein